MSAPGVGCHDAVAPAPERALEPPATPRRPRAMSPSTAIRGGLGLVLGVVVALPVALAMTIAFTAAALWSAARAIVRRAR